VNASYSIGKGLIAAEWQEASNDRTTAGTKGDVEAFQILVDYDFTDKIGAAIRYSNEDQDTDERTGLEISKFTVAPNYAITDSLGLIIEYTAADVDAAIGASSDDYDFVAAELTYTF
jgi:predicted porin